MKKTITGKTVVVVIISKIVSTMKYKELSTSKIPAFQQKKLEFKPFNYLFLYILVSSKFPQSYHFLRKFLFHKSLGQISPNEEFFFQSGSPECDISHKHNVVVTQQ